jgi:hypothetical protein
MTASHNPEKFLRKPFRLTSGPVRDGKPSHAVYPLVRIRSAKRIKPAVKRNSIIVDKSYNGSTCFLYGGISCTRNSAGVMIRDDPQSCELCTAPCKQGIVVIYDHEKLVVAAELIQHRLYGLPQ